MSQIIEPTEIQVEPAEKTNGEQFAKATSLHDAERVRLAKEEGGRILAPFTQDPASASMAQRNPICSFDADGMAICRVLPRTSILLP